MREADLDEVASSRGLDRSLRWGFGFLAAAIVLAPELFASATTAFLAPVAGLVTAAAIVASGSTESTSLRTPARVLVAVVSLLALYTLAQLAPIPLALLEKLAPFSAEAWSRALHPLGIAAPASASIPARAIAISSLPAASGTIVAAIIGPSDESGPRTRIGDGPTRAYATRQITVV